ncbi:sigma-70 family RNA polymerase sigma factor [Nakamurella sp. YIM 132087]|uniref:Sigma-70 family RNA polymerase sigma factor n=2 Tax=Nakamurella alba TaxID=2665158 RepID=A0A7K1FT99_9ACTN|nr:sigma-70 family RNA polymerase sigma factor [Nakamurella alba]
MLFRAEYAGTVRLATLLGADDPENLAQEAFVRLHDRWDKLSDPAAAGGYLRATVTNLARSRHRHLKVVRRWSRPQPEPVHDAELIALQRADHRAIIAALQQLSDRHREALVLRYWLDLSEKDIAAAMGVAQGTVKSHVSRGLSALRTILDTTSGGPS